MSSGKFIGWYLFAVFAFIVLCAIHSAIEGRQAPTPTQSVTAATK